ncbi:MAG TPA: NUDIX hydrolase [Alphaproteobacteria bacterium]|nr:NUDIX hydrolase [Alphaproteobacteria bacterium]
MENIPKVGVALILTKNKKVLLGKRKNSHGEESWAFVGGHLEFKESSEECILREMREEIGDINIKNLRRATFTNDIFEKENKHYVTIFMQAEYFSGEIKTLEPNKCEKWEWFDWNDLPNPLFIPIQNLIKQKYNPFE